jgi:hypothetical protein
MAYRSIETRAIIKTIETLNKRIGERFPGRGLNGVGAELLAAAQDAQARTTHLQQPWLWVRASSAALVAGGTLVLGLLVTRVQWPNLSQLVGPGHETGVFDVFSGVEAAANVVLLFGAGVFFVLRHEERAKRRQALAALHELRSLAHVIDMHQLTKDPTVMLTPGQRTPSAPKDVMTAFELVRYLDYCAEMLSLTGKIAALYAERVQDSVVIEAVNDIEALTTNFARKIWQKISLVQPTALERVATI